MNQESQRRHKAATNSVRAAVIAVALGTLSAVGTALAATPDDDCIAGSCGLPHWEEPRQGLPHQHLL